MRSKRHEVKADEELPFPADTVAGRLLEWYGRAGRELPWRATRDPYRIWLSEIMLQQTTVTAVVEYYRRFLERFPDVRALAAAPLEEVIDLWSGLGYYARARNLHAAARMLVAEFDEIFPAEVEQLMQLPGIGRSTAGAIAALAFERHAPILDANVRRVLCRLCALQQPPRSSVAEKLLWRWAELLTPKRRVHDYTQAIMDLGALVCTPTSPRCGECPLEALCRARQLDLVDQLPLKAERKKVPTRRQLALLLVQNSRCLVRRRPPRGLLGGLWEFPTLDDAGPAEEHIRRALAGLYAVDRIDLLGRAEHSYSHFRLEVAFYRAELRQPPRVGEEDGVWIPLPELDELALHGAHKKLVPLIGA